RWLLAQPASFKRMSVLLEALRKRKAVTDAPAQLLAMLDTTLAAVEAPDAPAAAIGRAALPPLHAYIRHLVQSSVTPGTMAQTLEKLESLPWRSADPAHEFRGFLSKTLLRVERGRAANVSCVAALLANMHRTH